MTHLQSSLPTDEMPIDERTHASALALANAGELAVALLREIGGKDIASSIDGASLTRDMVRNITYRNIFDQACKAAPQA